MTVSTSMQAFDELQPKLGARQFDVLQVVGETIPRTARELERLLELTHAWAGDAHKRLPELLKLGLVKVVGTRRCLVTGKNAKTWLKTTNEERAERKGPPCSE